MKIPWWRGLALAVLLLAAGVLAALTAALQAEPTVAVAQDVNHEDVARALSLLRTHDPRSASPGVVTSAWVHERDVEVLLNHAAHRWFSAASRVRLQPGLATLQLSMLAPGNPFGAWFSSWFGRWLNVELQVKETARLPVIDSFRIGRKRCRLGGCRLRGDHIVRSLDVDRGLVVAPFGANVVANAAASGLGRGDACMRDARLREAFAGEFVECESCIRIGRARPCHQTQTGRQEQLPHVVLIPSIRAGAQAQRRRLVF